MRGRVFIAVRGGKTGADKVLIPEWDVENCAGAGSVEPSVSAFSF